MRSTHLAMFGLAATMVAAVGCSPDFSPYWKIDKLRVMTIQADPVVAKPFEPVELSALAYAPDDQQIEYDWSWCPLRLRADDEYECPVDAEDFEQLASDGDQSEDEEDGPPDDPFDLGEGPETTFVNPLEADQVREFCETIQEEIIREADDDQMAEMLPDSDCEEGYEISVRLEVTTDDDSLVATKRFTLWGGSDEYNENPEFEGFEARPAEAADLEVLIEEAGWEIDEDADRDEQWVSVPEDRDLATLEGIPIEFRALVDPESLQTYTPAGADEPREEGLVYRHFATGQELSSSRHVYGPETSDLEEVSKTDHTMQTGPDDEECPEIADEGCRLHVWSVVRDDRLGVDWIERSFLVREYDEN